MLFTFDIKQYCTNIDFWGPLLLRLIVLRDYLHLSKTVENNFSTDEINHVSTDNKSYYCFIIQQKNRIDRTYIRVSNIAKNKNTALDCLDFSQWAMRMLDFFKLIIMINICSNFKWPLVQWILIHLGVVLHIYPLISCSNYLAKCILYIQYLKHYVMWYIYILLY